jgi:hypothetical protein
MSLSEWAQLIRPRRAGRAFLFCLCGRCIVSRFDRLSTTDFLRSFPLCPALHPAPRDRQDSKLRRGSPAMASLLA